MSLINRMLRDLSTRRPEPGNVMEGIQLRPPERRGSGRTLVWILVAGIVAFTALFVWTQPKKLPVPGPRAAVVAAGAPAAAPGASTRFRLDSTLSPPIGGPAPPKASPPKASPPRHRGKPTGLALDTAAPLPEPKDRDAAPAKPASARDTREAQSRYAEARRALLAGNEKDAEQGLTGALALDPTLRAAREDLGSLRIRQGRLDEADRLVRDGLAQDPEWVGYRRLSARLSLARGQPEAALSQLDHSQPAVSADAEFHGLLAAAYQRLDRHEAAARTYQALADAQPEEAHWWAGLGISRDALGDAPGALAAYARARSLGNLDARLLDHINKRAAALQPAG